MRVERWRCDKCTREYPKGEGVEILYHVDNERDPVDSHTCKVYRTGDYCVSCARLLIHTLLKDVSMETQWNLAKNWGARNGL